MRSYAQGPHPCSRVPCVLLVWRIWRACSSRALDVLLTSSQRARLPKNFTDLDRHPAPPFVPRLLSHAHCALTQSLYLAPYLHPAPIVKDPAVRTAHGLISVYLKLLHVLLDTTPGSTISQDLDRALWCHNSSNVRQTCKRTSGMTRRLPSDTRHPSLVRSSA